LKKIISTAAGGTAFWVDKISTISTDPQNLNDYLGAAFDQQF
jgi:hypothetical protein